MSSRIERQPRLRVVPCGVVEANDFIERVHRHHGPIPLGPGGHRFCIAAIDEDARVRGVATVGRPVAANRMTGGDFIAEVSRVATDGCANACSALYGAAARACKALGYAAIVTYILEAESGTSLRAAGWERDAGWYGGITWTNHPRPGHDRHPLGPKGRWRKALGESPRELVWPAPDPDLQNRPRSMNCLLCDGTGVKDRCNCLPEPDGINDCCPLHGEEVRFPMYEPTCPACRGGRILSGRTHLVEMEHRAS